MTTTKKPTLPTPIENITHQETRVNIPTEQMRDFVPDDEGTATTLLYPRDPSLDPQLVWKGKDEQDAADLAVPVVPVYIQEKIHPKAIIENLRAEAAGSVPQQAALFADFDGIAFEEMVEFYQHEQHWANRLILGDALLVMASLAEKEGLKGKVQTIYMDPPYGIKFGSNWQVSTRKRDVKDGKAEDATRQPEQIRAFRDTWALGIHSYLAYLRDRLTAARDLLTESGSIFVQIGDENVHLVRCLMDEVFGSENFCAEIGYKKTGTFETLLLQRNFDYVLWYAKTKANVKFRQLFQVNQPTSADTQFFDFVQLPDGTRRLLANDERRDISRLPSDAHLIARNPLNSEGFIQSLHYPFKFQSETFAPPVNRHWTTTHEGMKKLGLADRLIKKGATLRFVRYWADHPASEIGAAWTDTGTGGFVGDEKVYVVQTDTRVLQRCILMTTDPGDLVLDPTCGSGTTAYVAEQWGRRWITIDTSRVALALARTRLMAAKYPYYLLADTAEGAKKEAEIAGLVPPPYETHGDVRKGFVYKRVPHVTLKSIANNEEIDTIHARWQAQMEPLRAELNAAVGQAWEEWQVPREVGAGWPEAVTGLHARWWAMRRQRQAEIDASIARRAETELLYDQPYEDAKRIRVTGPFTVESLSPHRVLAAEDDERPTTEKNGAQAGAAGAYEAGILDNLRKAGVQNTVKQERLIFDRLDPYAGTWIQAEGEYTENNATKRVAVSIGPQYGTVDKDWIKEASKEAVQGIGFSLLIVCGFAFDAAVSEETRRYGKLTILIARMNPDLTMGDDLLKKTGTGNLFMVFGEPDILINTYTDDTLKVEIRGVDVYDPTTGQIRSHTTDDIACWFIDTDYNGESFFVRHAYFTGADAPYERLKRALRAEIDEATWASLYSTVSRPFDKPKTGKIAVKVINHYGDEVLKVYTV